MQTFLHYRWSVPSTLHRLHLRRIIPLLLLALCVTGAKAQSDVTFNGDIRYSKWVIDSRMNNFYANTTPCGFAVYDQSGTQTSMRVDGKTELDYVVGLVAKSIIEASQYYSQYTWAQSFAKPWFLSIQNYGDYFYNRFRSTSGSLDDLNAVKLFIPLRALTETKGKYQDATTFEHTTTALNTALTGLSTHNSSYSIKSGTTAETAGKTVAGGWWHKSDYQDQMWLDGSYMGPALFAQLVNYSNKTTNIDATNDWDLIVKQFTILRNMCWNPTDKLLYHAFAADGGTNSTSHSDTWYGLSDTDPYVFHSASYWGRAVGWYFLALVDVLEQMEKANIASTDLKFTTLKGYLEEIAEGIKARQDKTTGGWYQILDDSEFSASSYNNGESHTTTKNYIESSATALFTAAYLKAIRKGYLNDVATYKTVAENGYKCLVNQFFSVDANGKVNIFGSCRSAGLGGSGDLYKAGKLKYRNGSKEYYLLGSDVARVDKSENETEGKVLGAFIMAATEYERVNEKAIRFSYDLAPSYTLAQGGSIPVEALGSGAATATYQWYKTTDGTTGTAVTGATTATFSPTESGSYYCEAKSGSTTIKTSPTVVRVEGTDGIENDGSNGETGQSSATEEFDLTKLSPTTLPLTVTGTYFKLTTNEKGSYDSGYKLSSGSEVTISLNEGKTATVTKVQFVHTEGKSCLKLSETGGKYISQTEGEYFNITSSNTLPLIFAGAGVNTTLTKVIVTYTTGTAVLNPSDLACTERYNNNNAWTPAVNGTIDVSKLVSSSSKGAYSITTGTDVATISGTTITALKAGTFTLSQEVDDKYKPGTIEITVRIGTDVTSDETNEYSFTAQTDVSDGMTIACKDITMTFGNDGFWSQPSADRYTNGQRNPIYPESGSDAYIPTAGTYYKFTPTKPGQLAVNINLGTKVIGGNHCLRPLFVSENGTLISAKLDDNTQVGKGEIPEHVKYTGNVTFDVKKGIDYYIFVNSSKVGFKSFTFTPATTYTITYNMNGHGTQIEEVTDVNTLPETLPTPTADGYTFVGWYTNAELTQEATAGATLTSDVTLYAKWTPITDLFTLTGVTSTTVSVNSKATVKVSGENATITGGSAELYNGHSLSKDMILNSQINLNGSGSSYLKITLNNSLKIGDEIIINPAASSFKLSDKASNSDAVSFTGSYVIKEGDAVVGKNVIYLYKGSNSLIEDINITRYYPESDSRATFTYNGAEIAFSEETAGDKSAYTTTLEIGASKKEQTLTITPAVKDGASIKQGETAVSGHITITVPSTIGQTTTSTYTVTSKDGTSTTKYEINVTLVKENVVLVFADSDGKTEWTWDKTTNPEKPKFTQPTLKAYLAETYGKEDVTPTEVTINSNITYLSDVTDVATVVETTGVITIKSDANGGAKIYAILKNNSDYNDAQTFFNILVKQGYSYSVAEDATIANGPDLNESVYIKNGDTKLVKMTFGGWKWSTYEDIDDHNKLKSTYEVNGSTRKDGWNMPTTSDESDIASIDGYKTYISGYSDAVDESKKKSDDAIYGSTRYGWFKPAEKRSDGYLETYPYTLPVRGAYMTFEPTQNGKLTVYILQNGAWNTNSSGEYKGINYNNGEIVAGEFRPHSFYICNQRGLNVDQFSPNTFTVTTKQKVQGDYYCDLTNNQTDPKNIATWDEFSKNMSTGEQDSVAKNWNKGINGAQKIVKLANGSYLAIQKGIVKYSFFVTANETYYLFSNFSKLGFCGANFVPSETVVPADDAEHKIALSDETAYPKTEKVIIDDTDPDKIKYAWKFGNEKKGYVPGFTIPLFNSITLNRTFKKDQWTTLTLPFNLTQTEVEQIFGKGTQILVFEDAITTGTKLHIKFFYHEIQNILPGYPYLIKPTLVDDKGADMKSIDTSTDNAPIYTIYKNESGDLFLTSFTVYDKAINPHIKQHEFTANSGESYVAKGTPEYCTEALTGVEGNFCKQYGKGDIFISEGNGKLYISKGSSYGKGYRSYIDYIGTETSSASTKTLSLTFSGVEDGEDDGTTTEISVAELADDVIEAFGIKGVYNLNGQKVAETTRNLPAGIYVVNGRKVVVK